MFLLFLLCIQSQWRHVSHMLDCTWCSMVWCLCARSVTCASQTDFDWLLSSVFPRLLSSASDRSQWQTQRNLCWGWCRIHRYFWLWVRSPVTRTTVRRRTLWWRRWWFCHCEGCFCSELGLFLWSTLTDTWLPTLLTRFWRSKSCRMILSLILGRWNLEDFC